MISQLDNTTHTFDFIRDGIIISNLPQELSNKKIRKEKNMTINEKIAELRNIMKENRLDFYYIDTADYHCSEYIGDYFKEREYMSGFTGSAGHMLITQSEALLWTDGRYFIQAEEELKGTEIKLCKSGVVGVKTTEEYISEYVLINTHDLTQSSEAINKESRGRTVNSDKSILRLGCDGRCVSAEYIWKLKRINGLDVDTGCSYVSQIWDKDTNERPEIIFFPAYELDTMYSGEHRKNKLIRVREAMKSMRADYHVLASLDDIAWLLNLRGCDIHCNPVVYSFLIMDERYVTLYINPGSVDDELLSLLKADGVDIEPYDKVYARLKEIPAGKRIHVDMKRINAQIYDSIQSKRDIYNSPNPEILMKAIKNETECKNVIKAHIKDGVAITKLLYWLKVRCRTEKISKDGYTFGLAPSIEADEQTGGYYLIDEDGAAVTEMRVAKKLEELRQQLDDYAGPSFDTISAYGAHGAIVHYGVDEKSDVLIQPGSMLLLDMGGQYPEGTTDITRTVYVNRTGRMDSEELRYEKLFAEENSEDPDYQEEFNVEKHKSEIKQIPNVAAGLMGEKRHRELIEVEEIGGFNEKEFPDFEGLETEEIGGFSEKEFPDFEGLETEKIGGFSEKEISDFEGTEVEKIGGFSEKESLNFEGAETEIIRKDCLIESIRRENIKRETDQQILGFNEKQLNMKKHYTAVLKGHLALANAQFLAGCSGVALDILARKPLWDMGLDYMHGTGHGVGYFLNVHEAPNAFRYKILSGAGANPVLVPGMITSDEPGIYLEGEYGIRIENLILCEKRFENEYGTYLGFKNLTCVPYETELIDYEMLTDEEKNILEKYQKNVYDTLKDYLTEAEKMWLNDSVISSTV